MWKLEKNTDFQISNYRNLCVLVQDVNNDDGAD